MHVDNFIYFPILPLISPGGENIILMDCYFLSRNAGRRENKNFTSAYEELAWRAETLPVNDRH